MYVGCLWCLLWARTPFVSSSPKAVVGTVVQGCVRCWRLPLAFASFEDPCIGPPLHVTAMDAAAWPFPPTPDLPLACPRCSAPPRFTLPALRGCFFGCTLVPHSCTPITLMHARKRTSASAALRPPSCSQFPPFPAWQQGLAGKRGAESPGMCIHLSCSLLLEVEGKARGARRGRLPPKGRADIYKRAGVLPLDLSWLCSRENHVSEKSWQHRWLPSGSSALDDPLSARPSGFWIAAELHVELAVAPSLCFTPPCAASMNHRCCAFPSKDWKEFSRAPKSLKVNGSWEPKAPLRSCAAPAPLEPWCALELGFPSHRMLLKMCFALSHK